MLSKNELDRLVQRASEPIDNDWLDSLWEKHKDRCAVRRNYYRFLYHLVKRLQPKVSVELGVEFGLASAHMAVAARSYGGLVIGIDRQKKGTPADEIPKRCPNYHYVLGDTVDVLLRIVQAVQNLQIGLVFQDSSHHVLKSEDEWYAYSPYLVDGAVWVCDDITLAFHDPKVDPPGESMETYFDALPGTHYKFRDVLHFGNTIGVVLL